MTQPSVDIQIRRARHKLLSGMRPSEIAKELDMEVHVVQAERRILLRAGCMDNDILTIDQAALVMGVIPRYVRSLVAQGRLGTRHGKHVCTIGRKELLEYPVERHRGTRGQRELAEWRKQHDGYKRPRVGMVRRKRT